RPPPASRCARRRTPPTTPAASALVSERVPIRGQRAAVEADEADEVDARLGVAAGADGDRGGGVEGVAVDAGRDGREGDGPGADLVGHGERTAVGGGEELGLAAFAAVPHRSDGVDDPAGGKAKARGG